MQDLTSNRIFKGFNSRGKITEKQFKYFTIIFKKAANL